MSDTYKTLPVAQAANGLRIRLVEILPRLQPDDLISCVFHTVSLADLPKYTAVSYMWGNEVPDEVILLNGQPFTVRTNLWTFLDEMEREQAKDQTYHARLQLPIKKIPRQQQRRQEHIPLQHTFYWVDALCINQADTNERNHQVGIMGSIYLQAELVISWLGTRDDEVIQGLKVLKKWSSSNDGVDQFQGQDDQKCRGPACSCTHMIDRALAVCNHVYWTRLWIVQEFILAPRILLFCGSVATDADIILAGVRHLTSGLRKSNHILDVAKLKKISTSPASSLVTLRSQQGVHLDPAARGGHSLSHLLTRLEFSQCSDPRDRIYGLLSLIDKEDMAAYPLVPDYRQHVGDLCLEVMQHVRQATWRHGDVEGWNSGRVAKHLLKILGIAANINESSLPHLVSLIGRIESVHKIQSWANTGEEICAKSLSAKMERIVCLR
ncbi:hypothetical protein ACN47E_006865 [Coniothyrium glycines]